jgi:hypothetical protein
MKVSFIRSLFLLGAFLSGCAVSAPAPRVAPDPTRTSSVGLTGSMDSGLPVIGLRSGTLTLEFDAFHPDIRYYAIRFRHLNRAGDPSPLLPGVYMAGQTEDLITDATASTSDIPVYVAYRYRFPNETVSFTRSGRYAADVIDPQSGATLFSLPFFIVDSEGEARLTVREWFHHASGTRIAHQPVLEFRYPPGYAFPDRDHHVAFVQNRWFDQAREATLADMSEDGTLVYELREQEAFPGAFDILSGSFRISGSSEPGAELVDAGAAVPQLVRDPDVFGLTPVVRGPWINRNGSERSRDARYGLLTFRLDHDTDAAVMLMGTFNRWHGPDAPRMRLTSDGYREATVLVKEGRFHYAYVPVDGTLPLTGMHSGTNQEYSAFVYRKDPAEHYDRLVQIRTIRTR